MTTHPLHISEETYHRLSEQAEQLHLTPEQVVERLLAGDHAQPTIAGNELDLPVPSAGSEEALAAAHRLTTLFADVVIPDLDQTLADPMIALANADVAPAPHYS